MPRIAPGEHRGLPSPGDESALMIERSVDAIGPRLDELDPAVGQPVTPEEPGAEVVRDGLAEAIGMVGSPGDLSHRLHRHFMDPHRCRGSVTPTWTAALRFLPAPGVCRRDGATDLWELS